MLDSPEQQFLLNVLRNEDKNASEKELDNIIKDEIEWDNVWIHPKLEPTLYFLLKDSYKDMGIPEGLFNTWKKAYLNTAIYNDTRFDVIYRLASECKKSNIDIIFLKGSAEILTVYKENIGLRPMNDIDVLVKPSDMDSAESILSELNFKSCLRANISREEQLAKMHKLEFTRRYSPNIDVEVCLHKALFGKTERMFSFSQDWLLEKHFKNKIEVGFKDGTILIPDTDTLIETLILHGVQEDHFPYRIGKVWFLEEPSDIYYFEYDQEQHFLLMAYRLKKILGYFRDNINWNNITKDLARFRTDYRIKQFLCFYRYSKTGGIPDEFYSLFGIPETISEKFWRRMTRKTDAMFLNNAKFLVLEKEMKARTFFISLITYIFGLKNILRIKNLYRRFLK